MASTRNAMAASVMRTGRPGMPPIWPPSWPGSRCRNSAARRCLARPSRSQALPQRPERNSELVGQRRGLLPRSEVAALGQAVVVDQLGIGLLCPALRRLVDLVGEGADGDRDLDAARVEEAAAREVGIVPVEAGGRDRSIGQP